MSTKVDIISGFLGAGKTTFIKKFLEQKPEDCKVVLIENEFGEIGIDQDLFWEYRIHIKEIRAGCICCSLTGDFQKALAELVEKFNPHRIIIEPSGVGKTSDIIRSCLNTEADIKIGEVITIVDPLRFSMYLRNFREFYIDQIHYANTIIMSRTQNMDNQQIQKVQQEISLHNKEAYIITNPWDELDIKNIYNENKAVHNEGLEGNQALVHHHGDTHFEAVCFFTSKIIKDENLSNMVSEFEDINRFGMIIRAKGIIKVDKERYVQFDYVPNELTIKHIPQAAVGKICIIGSQINKQNIEMLAEQYGAL